MITGKRIRRFRHLRNYKQEYIARKMGLSVRTYRKLENEEIPLTDSRKRTVLEALETTLEELLQLEVKVLPALPSPFSSFEKELYERLLSEKEALIKQKDEEIIFLRDVVRRSSDLLP